mmetsp:Transcript_18396/g.50495  ORF Transcript_18396/g.50495 Transcript_18396/m.50495 type:complete len:160 (-) Transcript_18396:116-595(-)|eukprot:CAMPEP_0117557242 /NCGR_PEP_ID=MMETSP0784-20121206/52225_1 /TAXON_ID=39447 /ORGANISM="" /LENGTH=159 /DNA_ID=CAMNT_0005354545 /DNA_START=59 /DNA_END=538 /DNA_ORIENTATION=-
MGDCNGESLGEAPKRDHQADKDEALRFLAELPIEGLVPEEEELKGLILQYLWRLEGHTAWLSQIAGDRQIRGVILDFFPTFGRQKVSLRDWINLRIFDEVETWEDSENAAGQFVGIRGHHDGGATALRWKGMKRADSGWAWRPKKRRHTEVQAGEGGFQ